MNGGVVDPPSNGGGYVEETFIFSTGPFFPSHSEHCDHCF
jgi:hypothetical protein